MKQKGSVALLIIVIVVAVLAAGGVGYYYSSQDDFKVEPVDLSGQHSGQRGGNGEEADINTSNW